MEKGRKQSPNTKPSSEPKFRDSFTLIGREDSNLGKSSKTGTTFSSIAKLQLPQE